MFYLIYKTTNIINNKIYIGLHVTSNINDNYLGSGFALKKAIKKYGIASFKREILYIFDNKIDMVNKEKELVNEEFIARNDTYNISMGGFGMCTLTDEKKNITIEKIRKSNKERDSTESSRQRIETLLKKDVNIFKLMGLKSSIKQKENYKNGYINPKTNFTPILIYDNLDNLQYKILKSELEVLYKAILPIVSAKNIIICGIGTF